MKLKKLEISGFKSFAERVEMDFNQGITGVVGPNGSGKSNISDAVRWVLGEQSAKTLRGAKMEDVIFNGTEKRRRQQWCEVTLTFDNADHGLPLDFSEVAVTRRVYRNGDSEYAINRTSCRLRDVVELFRDTGIGREGYSLIGQGRIDEILSAKSEDRRRVFEEAAGVVKFKTRQQEAQRRLENTSLNLTRVEDILSELQGRLEPLREQSASAREYLALQGELKGLELNAFLLRSERGQARLDELKGLSASLAEAAEQSDARMADLIAERERMQEVLATHEVASAEARERVQCLIRDVEAREGAANVLKERVAASLRERERLTAELTDDETASERANAALEALTSRIASDSAELAHLKAALTESGAALERDAKELAEREEAVEALKRRAIDEMNRLSDVKSEQARLGAMKSALEGRVSALADELAAFDAQTGEAERSSADAEARLEAEKAEKARLDELMTRAQAELKRSAAEGEQLSGERRDAEAALQQTASRLSVLEEMQRDYNGYQFSVKQVLLRAEKEQGSGVHGVVATLIRAPKEVERAVDMALGAALQNVVVEREEDAKRMIAYLRANNMGRATFLPLDAVRGRTLTPQERGCLRMAGCLGVASELVSYEERYRGVVESLLGRTLIAESLDAGIAIQRATRHALRLVTLDGDVMNPGGSMTGGSVQSRMTSLLSREREIEEHRARVQELREKRDRLARRMDAGEESRAALKQGRSALFDKLRDQDIACAREEARLRAERDAQRGLLERRAKADSERRRMEAQLNEVASSLAALDGRRQESSDSGEDRQAEIAAGSREVARLRAALEAAREKDASERVLLASGERDLEAARADERRTRGELEGRAGRAENARDAREACEASLSADERQLADDLEVLSACKLELDEARTAFSKADGARTEAQRALQTLSERADKLRGDMDGLADRRHRCEMQLSRVEAEMETLQKRVWEDYELSYAGALAFRTEDFKLSEADKRISQIRARVRELGAVNVGAVDEFRQTQERFDEMSAQRDDLEKARLDLMGVIGELQKNMEAQFTAQFRLLNENFQQTFVRLFGGGRAELRLDDPKDALNCPIEVVAQPPGKKLQMLSLLSGGERALTAIAILFAMLKLKPTPFCFLDEIEAALDDANIDNFAEYLRQYSRDTQFIVVTHRKGTMERCDALYGVAMEEKGVSKMVSVKLSEAV